MARDWTCPSCGERVADGTAERIVSHRCEPSIGERYARRHGPVTRDELLTAIDKVRFRLGQQMPSPEAEAIYDALGYLAQELQ